MTEDHPALLAARRSWKAAMAGDREAWLGLMAEDVVVEDPIGTAPTNPSGEGVRGKEALAAFFTRYQAVYDVWLHQDTSRLEVVRQKREFDPQNTHNASKQLNKEVLADQNAIQEAMKKKKQ